MATITGNYVDADPTQWWTLDYTFANSKFTWSVTAHASHTSYWNTIYGLTVNVGGNSYYKGDITWQNYTPNTVVYSGTTNLTDCTISNGVVTLSVSGNFYYGTWNSAYTSYGSGTCAVSPPTVTALTYTATNKYGNNVVSGGSVITFTMKGTTQTASSSSSITYTLYQDGSAISTSTGTSNTNKTINVTAPSAGSHSYYYRATDVNGTTSTSGTISITTYAYTAPSFNSVSAVRWTTGTSSGTASDEGTYCKATASWNVGKVGTTNLTTTLKVTVNSTSSTTTTSGTSLYMGGGNLLADNSYTVTFTLYDSYTGEANGVVRTDTLTMGGRGLDFVYANGHYGIAVGQKANAGYFDCNLVPRFGTQTFGGELSPLWINNGNLATVKKSAAGARFSCIPFVGSDGVMEVGQILDFHTSDTDTSDYSFRLTSYTQTSTTSVTRTSGWTIAGQREWKWGRLNTVSLWFSMPSSGTGYTGNRAFNGTIVSPYVPLAGVVGQGWFNANNSGSHSFAGLINNDGSITISFQDDCTFAGGYAYISWTYIN